MFRAMSQATRLAATALLSLAVGAVGGAYATRLVYGGGGASVDPSPEPRRTCPPCPDCPACPTPPPCDAVSDLPMEDDDPGLGAGDGDPGYARGLPDPDAPTGPGLSAGAIQQAFAAVRVAVAPCLEEAEVQGVRGMVLLDLTVTATGTEAFVTDATVSQRMGDVEAIEPCVQSHAVRARFSHKGGDGSQRLKVPLRIGD